MFLGTLIPGRDGDCSRSRPMPTDRAGDFSLSFLPAGASSTPHVGRNRLSGERGPGRRHAVPGSPSFIGNVGASPAGGAVVLSPFFLLCSVAEAPVVEALVIADRLRHNVWS